MDAPNGKIIPKEQHEVGELMRAGKYFDESRAWYQALYIGPISERTLFLIIATLAGMVALAGIVAVLSLLPITERPAVMVANARIDETALGLDRMRSVRQQMNPAVQTFLIKQYIFRRESYDAVHYPKDYAFVHAHSDEPTFNVYAKNFDPSNPQSPLVTLGERGQRIARIRWTDVNDSVEPKVATVRFSTETIIGDQAVIGEWTATIGFYYSDLVVTPAQDPVTGEIRPQTQEPEFQVVQYELNPASASQ